MDRIDYPRLIQDALRDVVRRVLVQAAEHGLPGDHHFLIAFRTRHPGVHLPKFLRDLYPDEMKIVVQRQYWDLYADEEAFSVTLSFSGSRQRLTVPLAAVTAFVDPSVELVLRFETPGPQAVGGEPAEAVEAVAAADEPGAEEAPERSAEVLRFDPSRRR